MEGTTVIRTHDTDLRDRNGTYTEGTYSDGRTVRVYGRRNGFAYLAFVDDLELVTKVPESWVSTTTPAERQQIRGACPETGRSASACLDQSHETCGRDRFVAEHYPAAIPLLENGWTLDAALNHVQGMCDRELCTGDHSEALSWWER